MKFDFLTRPSWEAAPMLLGCHFIRELDGHKLVGRIVETEAYDQTDPASHSFRGQTNRTRVMFGPAGHLYVYFTYGMHFCANIVTGEKGHGSGVLIRAIEPLEGWEQIALRRPVKNTRDMTNGPAKLTQAFGIDMKLSGHDLREPPLQLEAYPPLPTSQIITTTRIGISQARDTPWRFYIKDNEYVSKIIKEI